MQEIVIRSENHEKCRSQFSLYIREGNIAGKLEAETKIERNRKTFNVQWQNYKNPGKSIMRTVKKYSDRHLNEVLNFCSILPATFCRIMCKNNLF